MATTANPRDVTLEMPLGADLTVRGTIAEVITSWTFSFVVSDADGTVIFSKTSSSGITATQSTPTGIIDIDIDEADTDDLTAGLPENMGYRWAVWRTNASSKAKLAGGPLVFVLTPEVSTV